MIVADGSRYDPNDLALDTFTKNIIAQELSAIIARPFAEPETWLFSADNHLVGRDNAETMQYKSTEEIRRDLATLGADSDMEGQGIKQRSLSGLTKESQDIV